ncbi:MAG: trigger factor [Chloroflexota bacterium]
MKVTVTPAERSTAVVEVEVTAERVRSAVDEAVRHQAGRVRVPGFRPGKVPRQMLERALGIDRSDLARPDPIYDDARDHLYRRSILEALREQKDLEILEIPGNPAWEGFSELSGARYRVEIPLRPTVTLGDYAGFGFTPEIEEVTPDKVDQVLDQLRDQQASLAPVEGRPAQSGDYAVVSFAGSRDGAPVEGAQADRFPLVLGSERMIPGFEDQVVGLSEGESKTFDITFPADYGQEELAGAEVCFDVTLLELRERMLPPLDDAFAGSLGAYADLAALRTEVAARLERNALDRARHGFADRIIEYAAANATVSPSDLLVAREIDVMVDELKVRLAQQGIGMPEYLEATERDEEKLREEMRESAEHRVKVLLVLGAVADAEQVTVPEDDVEREVARAVAANGEDRRFAEYIASPRGRSYVRSTLRRTRTVEGIIDRWIAEHPAFANVRHSEDQPDAAEPEAVA